MRHGELPAGVWWLRNAATRSPRDPPAGRRVGHGRDVPADRFQPMRSAYLSLRLDTEAEAERVSALLSEGGDIFMKMEKTFFSNRFAMLRDRFGTSWMLLQAAEPREQV